jgi:hypothetical protein
MYFDHIHPLRTLSFIHRPTFMHSLDRGEVMNEYGAALMYAIFALALRLVF